MNSEKLKTYRYDECWDILDLLSCYICYQDALNPKFGSPGYCELKFSTSSRSC